MAEVEVFDDRVCDLGEGPFFDDRTGRVGWVDIYGRRLLWREVDGSGPGELAVGRHVSAAVPRRDGGLVLCLPDRPVLVEADDGGWSGDQAPLGGFDEADRAAGITPATDARAMRANDAKGDPAGRLWVGTMPYDGTPGVAALYRLDPGAAAPRRMIGGVSLSNGLGWSPDRSTMYYVDTPTRHVYAFPYALATGEIGERRLFAEIDLGYPDGLCVDAEGGIWVAIWEGGSVRRYHPDGRLDRVVRVPTPRVTSCTFAGEDYRILIITTAAHHLSGDALAGLTYAHEPGDVRGVAVDRFGG